MNSTFKGEFESMKLEGKTVIVIDDGIATGNTLQFTIKLIKKTKPSKIVIAVPVASKSSVKKLNREVDEMICLSIPDEFYGVGSFYEDFKQVSDSEVLSFLSEIRKK
jgi:predicted phosphoribosyltransferase